jgi:hypothetical protein
LGGKATLGAPAAAVFTIGAIGKLLTSDKCGECGTPATVFQDWQPALPDSSGYDYRMCLDPEAFEQATRDLPDTDFEDVPVRPPASHLPATVVREVSGPSPDGSVEVEYAMITDNGDGTFTVYLDDGTVLIVTEVAADEVFGGEDKGDDTAEGSGRTGGGTPSDGSSGVGTDGEGGGPGGGGGGGSPDREVESDLEVPGAGDGVEEETPPTGTQQGEDDDNSSDGDGAEGDK